MQPTVVALGDQLGEAYLPRLLHLLYELEQATMVGLVARYQVGSTTEHVMAVLHASDERVNLPEAMAATIFSVISTDFMAGACSKGMTSEGISS